MKNQQDECCNRRCKWVGNDDEKPRRVNQKSSKESGVTINDLVCPKCGGREFWIRKVVW